MAAPSPVAPPRIACAVPDSAGEVQTTQSQGSRFGSSACSALSMRQQYQEHLTSAAPLEAARHSPCSEQPWELSFQPFTLP